MCRTGLWLRTKKLFSDPGTVSVARMTGCKNFSAAQRQDRGAGESRRIVTNGISQTWLSACFLPRLCPAFALPGNSLDDIGQTGGDCLFYGPEPVRQEGCPEGLRAPGKPALGPVFSEKRAGRPRIQAGPLAQSSRPRRSRTSPPPPPKSSLFYHSLSSASKPLRASGLLSPWRTNSMVMKARATNTVAYGNRVVSPALSISMPLR